MDALDFVLDAMAPSLRRHALRLAVLAGFLGAIVAPHAASALCNTNHCYSQATLRNAGKAIAAEGVAYVSLSCIGLAEGATNIMTDEMWATLKTGEWLEGGIITGATLAGQYELPGFFVSANEKKGKNAYENEHLGGLAPINTWNLTYARQATPNKSKKWTEWTAGTGPWVYEGFETSAAATELTVGLETSRPDGWNHGGANGLAILGANGNTYATEWVSGTHTPEIERFPEAFVAEDEPYFNWVSPNVQANFGDHKAHVC